MICYWLKNESSAEQGSARRGVPDREFPNLSVQQKRLSNLKRALALRFCTSFQMIASLLFTWVFFCCLFFLKNVVQILIIRFYLCSSQDLIIFPDDCEFKRVTQCTTGRVYHLKFKSTTKKFFFWLQVILESSSSSASCFDSLSHFFFFYKKISHYFSLVLIIQTFLRLKNVFQRWRILCPMLKVHLQIQIELYLL